VQRRTRTTHYFLAAVRRYFPVIGLLLLLALATAPGAVARRRDRAAPNLSFKAPLTGQKISRTLGPDSPACEVAASDNVGVKQVVFYVDGAPLNTDRDSPWQCTWDTTKTPDGSHVLKATASDSAGNHRSASVTVTVQNALPPQDTSPPETSINSGPSLSTTSTSASFSFSASESGSSFQCQLDSGGWGGCASPKGYGSLALGPHTFQVRATDAAGNTDPTPASETWTISSAFTTTALGGFPLAGSTTHRRALLDGSTAGLDGGLVSHGSVTASLTSEKAYQGSGSAKVAFTQPTTSADYGRGWMYGDNPDECNGYVARVGDTISFGAAFWLSNATDHPYTRLIGISNQTCNPSHTSWGDLLHVNLERHSGTPKLVLRQERYGSGAPSTYPTHTAEASGTVPSGKWFTVEVRARISNGSDGWAKLYVDGQEQAHIDGENDWTGDAYRGIQTGWDSVDPGTTSGTYGYFDDVYWGTIP
jgi:Bacterial Ig domain